MLKSILPSYDNSLKKQLRIDAAFSAAAAAVISFVVFLLGKSYLPVLQAIYFFCIVMFALLFLEPHSLLFKRTVSRDKLTLALAVCAFVATVLVCVIPMSLNPVWNGEIPDHRNQYEELADALLEGHLNVHADEDTSALSIMSNPYDAGARSEQNVAFEWDHAFYNGKYYVYFGIVPAIVLFVPYKLITGVALTTWKATAVFACFVIVAFFALGYKLIRKAGSKIPVSVWLVLTSGLSMVVLWFAVMHPALYCTAIVSGLCFVLLCVYFEVDAFYIKDTPPIWETAVGALCGALVFGCRPPIGLAEIVVLPFILRYINRDFIHSNKKRNVLLRAVAFALPYIIVAVLLMLYNYTRFENPFEFGQSYQLTVTDQTSYSGNALNRFSFIKMINWCGDYLLAFNELSDKFPWAVAEQGVFVMSPVLLLGLLRWNTSDKSLKGFKLLLYFAAVVIIAIQTLNVPNRSPRYQMDFVFLLCLATLFAVVYRYANSAPQALRSYTFAVSFSTVFSVIVVFLLFFASYDSALVDVCPQLAGKFSRFFALCSLQ